MPEVRIGRMDLRMPGGAAGPDRHFANAIGESLARGIPRGTSRRLGAVNVRVQAPPGCTGPELKDAIASAVVKAISTSRGAP